MNIFLPARFENLIVVLLKIHVFWDVMPCQLVNRLVNYLSVDFVYPRDLNIHILIHFHSLLTFKCQLHICSCKADHMTYTTWNSARNYYYYNYY